MQQCALEFARRFAADRPTKVLTAEISGIAPALLTALELKVPVVYARKHKPITMPDTVFLTTAPSHTKGHDVNLMVSPEYLAQAAGSTVIGVGALIEKTFEGGRDLLEATGLKVEALARIVSLADDRIVFVD